MVPRPGSEAEDDGWLLVFVWNGERRASQLLILNANDLSEQAVLEMPITIPYGLHGSWVAADWLSLGCWLANKFQAYLEFARSELKDLVGWLDKVNHISGEKLTLINIL